MSNLLPIEDALNMLTEIDGLSKKQIGFLEDFILTCNPIEKDQRLFIETKMFTNYCENYIKAIAEKNVEYLARPKGYKVQPVDIEEFLESNDYMRQKGFVRPVVKYELDRLFSNKGSFVEVVLCGGIGTGKTFFAEMAIDYMVYLNSCLENVQSEYDLAPGSSIYLVIQSVSLTTAKRALFEQMLARMSQSPYFTKVYPFDKKVRSAIKFQDGVSIIPVSSSEMAAIGLNTFGGCLTEANFFQVTEHSKLSTTADGSYDQAEQNYNTITKRMRSRFDRMGKLPGMMILDSSSRYPGDFLDRKVEEAKEDPSIFVMKYTQWEALPADRMSTEKFLVEVGTHERASRILPRRDMGFPDSQVIEVPMNYFRDFQQDCEGALRDFAGIAVGVEGAYIRDRESVVQAILMHESLYQGQLFLKDDIIINAELDVNSPDYGSLINQEYMKEASFDPTAIFAMHTDIGISDDSCGIVVGRVHNYKQMPMTNRYSDKLGTFIELSDLNAPVICFDGMIRIRPPHGGEVDLELLRGFLFYISQILNLKFATFDRFASPAYIQGFRKMKVRSGLVSMDATIVPYGELKNAYLERRLMHPRHKIYWDEVINLQHDPKKNRVDHKPGNCFTGDTRVALLDGTNPTFEELYNKYGVDNYFDVFSMGEHGIVVGRAKNPRVTRTNEKLMEITLDNFQVIRCTEDHLFMTVGGDFIEAHKLRPDISLMPFNRIVQMCGGWIGYPTVYDLVSNKMRFVHQIAAYNDNPRKVIHHINGNKLDNRPANLDIMDKSLHASIHTTRRFNEDADYVAILRDGHEKYRNSGGNEKSRDNILKLFDEGKLKKGRLKCIIDGCNSLSDARGMCDKHYQQDRRKRMQSTRQHKNHRVINVQPLDYTLDVWDIEVDDYHNFALTSGVFVHNSKDVSDSAAGLVHILTHKVAQYNRSKEEKQRIIKQEIRGVRRLRFR